MIGKLLLGILLLIGWLWLQPEIAEQLSDSPESAVEAVSVSEVTSTRAMVTYVVDGDTIEIAGGERVRLLGIDTPEYEECYFTEATERLRELVDGKEVRLESDLTDRDKYNRLLRHVFVSIEAGAQHVNALLVAEGYATVLPIPPDRRYREELASLETEAKQQGRGLWGVCEE
jgi:micrococcal nuclease